MHDPELEKAVRSIKKRKRSEEGLREAKARRKKLRKNRDAKCIKCQGKAAYECEGCYRFLCGKCTLRLGSRRFCSDDCIRQLDEMHDKMEAGQEASRMRDLRMFLADPWDKDLYRRVIRAVVIIAVAVILWRSMDLLTKSSRTRDIRDRGLEHGVNIEDVPVGVPVR